MQGLLSLYGWYYQSNTAKFNPPLYLFHHCFSLTLTSWPLCSASQKRLCEGELQEDWEIWQKISEKCSEGVTAASVYFGLTTFALEIGHRIAASVVSPLVCSLSLEQREGAQNKSVAQGPMTPARVLVKLLPIQALCSRSLPSVFREGGFGSYKSSSQQVLLLAAKWKKIGVKLLNQREKKSIL